MVKTRISCSLENELTKSLSGIPRNGRRFNLRRGHVMYNQYKEDDEEESDESSGYAAVPQKVRMERQTKFDVEPAIESTAGRQEDEVEEEEEEQDDNDDDDVDYAKEHDDQRIRTLRMKIRTRQDKAQASGSGLGSTIRRSTRQKKPMYDTLNQSWLLGSSRLRDFTTVVPTVMVHPSRSEVSSSEKLNENVEEEEEGSRSIPNDFEEYSDMYSRVKRERQKPKEDVYGMDKVKGVDSTEEDEEGDDEEESSIDGIHIQKSHSSKYCLRQTKPATNRFQVPVAPVRNRRAVKSLFNVSSPPHRLCKRFDQYISPACKTRAWKKRRRATHHTSSSSGHSSSSSSGDERHFDRRKTKSMSKARNRCLPLNMNAADIQSCGIMKDRLKIGSSLADVDPMSVDREVNFENVGGLSGHLQSLKEMIIFPLLYPEVFDRFKISPPRGVLFYGPPGTGKTLVARALANECSQEDKRVAFFMRKGADCLSKWVGESERQLRLLFDQAYAMRPSIIFFDEIDGLAPVRSSRQDQIHSSIVSTLLALMDGLDSRGEVVVIGATNRLDAIDPALRRPGRFDREFLFPLPSVEGRRRILEIHTGRWEPRLRSSFVGQLAEKTVGYCGADLKALCAEAALLALRRRYPQIYTVNAKLQLDVKSIEVSAVDFWKAMRRIVPSAHRCAGSSARALSPIVRPLLKSMLTKAVQALQLIFPEGCKDPGCDEYNADREGVEEIEGDIFERGDMDSGNGVPVVIQNRAAVVSHRPRLLLCGVADQGQTSHLAPAILHHFEHLPVHRMDLPALFGVTARAPEEACAQILVEARRVVPSVVYLPHVDQWWATVSDTVRVTFLTLLHDMDPSAPILLLATSDCPRRQFPQELQQLFNVFQGELLKMKNPSSEERRDFFSQLLLVETRKVPRTQHPQKTAANEELPLAPPPKKRTLNDTERNKLLEDEESTLRELRQFLRDILYKLARDRRFTIFTKPVNVDEVPDYLEVIHTPMDLEKMMTKIDLHKYETVKEFLQDVDLICQNALEYNPDRDPTDKLIRHRACALRDTAHSLIDAELDPEFELMCQEVQQSRVSRGESSTRFAPKNYNIVRPQMKEHCVLPPVENAQDVEGPPSSSSKKIRGLGASEPKGSTSKTREKSNAPKVITVQTRRRPSLWFGCHGRKIIRHHVIANIENGKVGDRKKSCKNSENGYLQNSMEPRKCDENVQVSAEVETLFGHKVNGVHTEKGDSQILITHCDVRLEVDAAVEAMLATVCKDPEPKEPVLSRTVEIDVRKLEILTDLAVDYTDMCSVETLEKLYCVLSRRVAGYKNHWDRTYLVKELEAEIERFQQVQSCTKEHVRS